MKLIFIHGSGGMKEMWYYQTKYFPDSEAIDLPGHPEGKPCTSMDGYVEWLRGYIHGRGYKDVVLAGHSLGGGIALLYGLKYPEDLKGLIIIGSGARLRVHPMFLGALEEAIKTGSMPEGFPDMSESLPPEVRDVVREKMRAIGPAVQLNDLLCCDKFDIMDRVHEIRLPTLALCGTQDEMTPVKYTKYLADKIQGARAVIIEGATHGVFVEKPDEVNKAIEEFLNSL